MKEKIPVRMYSLKTFYEEFGMDYVPTREAREVISKTHMYELRGWLDNDMWYEGMKNRDGSYIQASYALKFSNYWRVNARGILALYELFNIADENLREVAKKLLLGEEV